MSAKRTDGNQAQIARELRAVGLAFYDTHEVGQGFPDGVVVGYNQRTGTVDALLVEIKTARGKLTPAERIFHAEYPEDGPLLVARSADDILAWFGLI